MDTFKGHTPEPIFFYGFPTGYDEFFTGSPRVRKNVFFLKKTVSSVWPTGIDGFPTLIDGFPTGTWKFGWFGGLFVIKVRSTTCGKHKMFGDLFFWECYFQDIDTQIITRWRAQSGLCVRMGTNQLTQHGFATVPLILYKWSIRGHCSKGHVQQEDSSSGGFGGDTGPCWWYKIVHEPNKSEIKNDISHGKPFFFTSQLPFGGVSGKKQFFPG